MPPKHEIFQYGDQFSQICQCVKWLEVIWTSQKPFIKGNVHRLPVLERIAKQKLEWFNKSLGTGLTPERFDLLMCIVLYEDDYKNLLHICFLSYYIVLLQ